MSNLITAMILAFLLTAAICFILETVVENRVSNIINRIKRTQNKKDES